jgi:hypothetical protein
MQMELIKFPDARQTTDEVLDQCKEDGLTEVIVIGISDDGCLSLRTNVPGDLNAMRTIGLLAHAQWALHYQGVDE